jgi:hypothetical protein
MGLDRLRDETRELAWIGQMDCFAMPCGHMAKPTGQNGRFASAK